jgi:hypothetical protein
MLNLTKQQTIDHVVRYGNTIAYETDEPQLLFDAKYHIGDNWNLGYCNGKITQIYYFPKAEKPNGIVVFELLCEFCFIIKFKLFNISY